MSSGTNLKMEDFRETQTFFDTLGFFFFFVEDKRKIIYS